MIVRKLFKHLLPLMFLTAVVFAQPQQGEVVETILDNGLKVLSVEMHNAPIIYSQLAYKVGSRNEGVGSTGIAHITEHMMFKGTPTYPKGVISKLIKDNAGVFNAFTSNDITAYFEQMPKNKIDIALAIESDRMYNCVIDAVELEKELDVIMEERRMRTENNPSGIFSEEFNAIAFKCSPNHWPVIGWMDDIKNTSREDVFNFYRSYYTPNNATLVLVGDFETDEMLKKVEHYFGDIPAGPDVAQSVTSEPLQESKRVVTIKRSDVKTASMQIGWHTPAIGHPDNAALRVFTKILGGGSTSRLYKRLVTDENMVTRVSARIRFAKDPWQIVVSIETNHEKIEQLPRVKEIIFEEIHKIQQQGITVYELQKTKNRLEYNEIFENMKVSSIGGRLARYETYLSWKFYDEWKQQQKSVTLEDVKRVAKEYINQEHVTIGYLLPKSTADSATVSFSTIDSAEDHSTFYYNSGEVVSVEDNEIDVIKPKPIAPRIQQARLTNGIPVYFVHDKTVPIFSVRGFIRTGNCPEDLEKPGLGALTGRMMNRGTQTFSNEYLKERMDFVPFSFSVSGGVEDVTFSGSALTDYADSLLFYGFEILTNPAFNPDDLEIVRDQMIAILRRAEGGAGWKTSRFLFETIYGETHPYGRLITGGEEFLRKLTVDDLRAFHQKYYCPQHTVLCVLSDLTLEETIEKLNAGFGKWSHADPPELAKFAAPKKFKGRAIKVFPMPEKKQADVRIGGTLVPHGHADTDAIDVAVHILGGSSLSSRMGVNIRDEQGLAYNVSVRTRQRQKGGLWFMQSATKSETASQLLKSAIHEIENMRKEKVTDKELIAAKRYFIGTLPMVIETPGDILMLVFDMVNHGMPLDYFDNYADRVMAVTKEDVLRVMRYYFDPRNIVVVGAGPIEQSELDQFK
ncbi:MAG TPA: insulinase family protein [bacterium]|nr:insulinase family protein [bacterium]